MARVEVRRIDINSGRPLCQVGRNEFKHDLLNRLNSSLTDFVEDSVCLSAETCVHYICSSSLDIVCSSEWFMPSELCQAVYSQTGLQSSFSNAYQCASWGFALRYHLQHKPEIENVILSIIDANPLGMQFWENNPAWGRSDFKVTHILLHIIDAFSEDCLGVGKCNPETLLYDYAGVVRREADSNPGRTIVTPYFDQKMRRGLNKILRHYRHLPDLFEEYGHLYGADPWVSVARDALGSSFKSEDYAISSLASEGYYCFLNARLSSSIKVNLNG